MKKTLLVYALISLFVNVSDAQIPDTDIYLIPTKYENGKIILGKAVNITSSPGYDNQPCFSPNSKEILFVSIKDSVQSDVWKYDIATKTKVQLTKTKEVEAMFPTDEIVRNKKYVEENCKSLADQLA